MFSPTSHVLALVFGQLTHALGLNDICDTLRNHCGLVSKIRDCVPPSRNGLSHANRNRDAGMAEKLFWEVLAHLNEISPNFWIQGRRYCALPRRFKRMIHVVDSTTIQLIANCLDWAKHRRRKAAAKIGPLKFSSRRSNRLFNSQTSLATTRTRCAGKYGRLFSHIFYSALLHGRMNGSILLQDCSLPCAESSGAAWIWEVSSDVVGQHLTLSVCEALRNRHIYQDSHNYNPTQRKGKTGNG